MSLGYINGNLSEVPSAFGGETVNVGGVVYGWSDALGRYVPSTPLEWDTYALLVAAWPTALVGQTMLVKRILGTGHYKVQWTGSRWAVGMAEAPVRMDAEVGLTASAATYTQMVAATFGSLVGDGETWLFRFAARSGGVYTSGGGLVIRSSGSVVTLGSAASVTSSTARARRIGSVKRDGSVARRTSSGVGEQFSGTATADITVADWSTFSLEAGVTPGAIGDTYVAEEFIILREA